jgi:hypothetical protein
MSIPEKKHVDADDCLLFRKNTTKSDVGSSSRLQVCVQVPNRIFWIFWLLFLVFGRQAAAAKKQENRPPKKTKRTSLIALVARCARQEKFANTSKEPPPGSASRKTEDIGWVTQLPGKTYTEPRDPRGEDRRCGVC